MNKIVVLENNNSNNNNNKAKTNKKGWWRLPCALRVKFKDGCSPAVYREELSNVLHADLVRPPGWTRPERCTSRCSESRCHDPRRCWCGCRSKTDLTYSHLFRKLRGLLGGLKYGQKSFYVVHCKFLYIFCISLYGALHRTILEV